MRIAVFVTLVLCVIIVLSLESTDGKKTHGKNKHSEVERHSTRNGKKHKAEKNYVKSIERKRRSAEDMDVDEKIVVEETVQKHKKNKEATGSDDILNKVKEKKKRVEGNKKKENRDEQKDESADTATHNEVDNQPNDLISSDKMDEENSQSVETDAKENSNKKKTEKSDKKKKDKSKKKFKEDKKLKKSSDSLPEDEKVIDEQHEQACDSHCHSNVGKNKKSEKSKSKYSDGKTTESKISKCPSSKSDDTSVGTENETGVNEEVKKID